MSEGSSEYRAPSTEPTKSFKGLIVWQKSRAMTLLLYNWTKAFPQDEIYGLTSQIRRAAVSVEANIAEAYRKQSGADKVRVLSIAQCSLEEVCCLVSLAADLELISKAQGEMAADQLDEVARLLNGYMRAIPRKRLL